MLTLHQNNKEHLALESLTDAFLSSGREIKRVPGFSEVAPRKPAPIREPKPKPKPKVKKSSRRLLIWEKYQNCAKILSMAGIKHSDIAALVGVHKNTMGQYLRGTYAPTAEVAELIEKTIANLTGIKP